MVRGRIVVSRNTAILFRPMAARGGGRCDVGKLGGNPKLFAGKTAAVSASTLWENRRLLPTVLDINRIESVYEKRLGRILPGNSSAVSVTRTNKGAPRGAHEPCVKTPGHSNHQRGLATRVRARGDLVSFIGKARFSRDAESLSEVSALPACRWAVVQGALRYEDEQSSHGLRGRFRTEPPPSFVVLWRKTPLQAALVD